ncbi:MAG: hypothetical protein U9Q30_00635 [Campylobacterota bacterium]|nr:hypothetical protein [Campylobacterota bacterium]
MKNNNFTIISFYNFAKSIGVIKSNNIDDIEIKDLLLEAFLFLLKEIVLTKKQELEYLIFKDRYNKFLDYCIENSLIEKDLYKKIEKLNIITVPDMSKIEIPDIKDELKKMNIDLNNLSNIFGKISRS